MIAELFSGSSPAEMSFLEWVGVITLALLVLIGLVAALRRGKSMFGAYRMMVDEESKTSKAQQDASKTKVIPGGNENILLIDDEPLVLKVQSTLLSSLGYQTQCAEGGQAALEYLKENDADLLLLDLLMPDMDGVETYRRIKEIKPNQRAVVLTGYATPEQVDEIRSLGAGQYLIKPVPLSLLARAIRDELDGVK